MTSEDPAGSTHAPIARAPRLPRPPAPRAGLTWRALRASDLVALTELVAACEAADDPPYRTAPEELGEELFDGPDRHPENDTIAAVDHAGRIVAYGRVRVGPAGSRRVRVSLGGGVHPEARRRGLGAAVLTWQVDRARLAIATSGATAAGQIAAYVEDGMPDHVAMLARAGFAPARYYTEALRDLQDPIPTVTLSGSIIVEPWQAVLSEQVRLAHNEAYADHWGSEPLSPEAWREGGGTHFEPRWSFIAMDRSTDRVRVAGYLLSGRYEQDWSALGYTVGYTELIGVLREWRGRRVATALLLAAMRAYAADGIRYAGLTVDSATPQIERGLYERLGYRATRGSSLWTLDL